MQKLSLVGANIDKSGSPGFHNHLAKIKGIDLNYSLSPVDSGDKDDFVAQINALKGSQHRGVNVTYPFKECALMVSDKLDPSVERTLAANTLLFTEQGTLAYNTDYTGFIKAYKNKFSSQPPGKVVLFGTGGVGKAIAFALGELGAKEIALYDINDERASALASELKQAGFKGIALSKPSLEQYVMQAEGLVNCTPIGHYKTPGCVIDTTWLGAQKWAFDAVYTPLNTTFMAAAETAGLQILSGFELFFYQAIDAYELFNNTKLDNDTINAYRQTCYFRQIAQH
ncbi:shikimate dehydrogenase [Photobacterium sanctipauli]|uniref:Shikimate dehydrogenase n=1 Tax=Photobacterium sanctipauli TaxID=1342794 RepID=A0A2T3P110_9GAMM|nr:shikimate dehydrogenase [Photobacterium sanctipauli]PSW22211.1 shikimate dehydrogenase [Photobacterium sanctipauli]